MDTNKDLNEQDLVDIKVEKTEDEEENYGQIKNEAVSPRKYSVWNDVPRKDKGIVIIPGSAEHLRREKIDQRLGVQDNSQNVLVPKVAVNTTGTGISDKHSTSTDDKLESSVISLGCDNSNSDSSNVMNLKLFEKYERVEFESKKKSTLQVSEEKLECNVCCKIYTSSSDLNHHLDSHFGNKLCCMICDKSFTQLRYRKRHKCNPGTRIKRKFVCDICQKSFKSNKELTLHKYNHTGIKPFKCDFCNKFFKQGNDLKMHLRTHTGEKPFVCDFCNKSFTQLGHVKSHMRTHTGERPFACDMCDKSFAQFAHLKEHKVIHYDDKPFGCDMCEKTFKRPSGVKIHQRMHTGLKPFVCDVCGKSFGQSSSLTRHLKIHEKQFGKHILDS